MRKISYEQQILQSASLDIAWKKLSNKCIAITGATGMIGKYLIDVLMCRNEVYEDNIQIVGIGRNQDKLEERFAQYSGNKNMTLVVHNINEPLGALGHVDYMIHAASSTHPLQYALAPIETITTNVIGIKNVLDYATICNSERVLFLSSVEVYGENRGDVELFNEEYCGYIDCNTLRAGYPESKRVSESLCQAYIKEKNVDVVIARLSRTYGPTMLDSDTKAIAQFIKKGIAKEDIVLKSAGGQLFSYVYIVDAVNALLYILFNGEKGEAYNVASKTSNKTLKEVAQLVARLTGQQVKMELPSQVEASGYSKATKACLQIEKLQKLGWNSYYDMEQGMYLTLDILGDK